MDTKILAGVVGLIGSIGGAGGTYAVMVYRLDQTEDRVAALEVSVDALAVAVREAPREVECLIREVHQMDRMGCP
jgi:nitrate/nitrite transporter NarK